MHRRHPCTVCLLLLGTIGLASGCGWFGAEEPADEEEAELAEVEESEPLELEPLEEAEPLELNLEPGQRFPLIKTVEQSLDQGEGGSTSTSRLELLLAIDVREIQQDGRKKLGVEYHRVRYSHDIAGEHVEFDSRNPDGVVPPAAVPYRGLVGNGFAFWLGADNRILELVGFREFVEKCLEDVPAGRRDAVLARLEAESGDEGIANFVDDSIGLLPYDASRTGHESSVRVGHEWTRRRQIVRPVPLLLESRFTLQELTDDIARIEVVGDILPSTTYSPDERQGLRIAVRKGHEFGTCTIRRETGLPIESRIERHFDMVVHLDDGEQFEQSKRIVTTIRTFPEQGASETPDVLPVGAEESTSGDVTSADFSSDQP